MRRETTTILVMVLMLVMVGVMTVFSVTSVPPGKMGTFWHHIIALAIGMAGMYVTAHLDYHVYRNQKIFHLAAVVTLVLLVVVLLVGQDIRGAKRWIQILGFQFQPSEFAKIALVIFLAVKLADNQANIKSLFRGFLPPVLIAGGFA